MNRKQRIVMCIGVVFLMMTIIIITVSIFKSSPNPNVKLNFSEKNEIPNSELIKIRSKLSRVIQSNTEDFSNNTIYYGNVRNYKKEKQNDYDMVTFVVDFDELRQSYSVIATWPDYDDGAPNIIISCSIRDTKYPETICKTESNSSSDLTSLLPHTGEIDDGKKYEIIYKYSNYKPYLEVRVDSCGDLNIVGAALLSAKGWIESMRLNPDDYLFYAPTTICDNKNYRVLDNYIQANHANTNDDNVNLNLPYFIPGLVNAYPVVDNEGNVININVELTGCTDYQTDLVEDQVISYLESKKINYPISFSYCAN